MPRRLNPFSSAVLLTPVLLSAILLIAVLLSTVLFAVSSAHAQRTPAPADRSPAANTIPRLVEKDGRYALFVDGAPYLMLGAQVNNSSAWPSQLPKVWPTAEFLHQNTIEMPIYWEQFEPERGHYDPSLLHALLAGAREHHLHLVLLWFGTWKNGSGHYTPNFIKLDEADVPHVMNKDGHKVDSLAPHSQVALDADKAAFAELMKELKAADPQHTVIMVQVENESGTYGSDRDYSPLADKLFAENVPDTVLKAMKKTATGSWQQVFGDDASEFFHAYSIAHFVNQVAAAGKAQYPLPMYVNVALRDPFHPGHAGSYASGGPTDNVLPIWKAAAPSIDLIAPDIYMGDYTKYIKELDLYARPDNALLVPETANFPAFARYFYAALGHGAIGFSPFGMDKTGYVNAPNGATKISDEQLEPFALNYRIFEPMDRLIAQLNFEGKLKAVSEDPAVHRQTLDFPGWQAVVSYGLPQFGGFKAAPGNDPPDGGAMIAQLGPNEFLVTGVHARVDFIPTDPAKQRQFVQVQEGSYQNNVWKFLRIWNGDQTDYGLNFTSAEQVLRVTLATY